MKMRIIILFSIIFMIGAGIFLIFLDDLKVGKINKWIQEENNLTYINDVLDFNSLSLKQKLAQMIIVWGGDKSDLDEYAQLDIGGFFIDNLDSSEDYKQVTFYLEDISKIKPFLVTDLEGCWNPFEDFYYSQNFSNIKTKEQAYNLGLEHGKILKNHGFNMDFSPVLDLEDKVWGCRSFNGSEKEIAEKGVAYSEGLKEKGILSVIKHYPGKTLIKNSHDEIIYVEINKEDSFPFNELIKNNVSGVMLNHLIVSGEVNSDGEPVSISDNVIFDLRKTFSGLIITDEINMLGFKRYYCPKERNCKNKKQMYIDLFKSGNDIILNLAENKEEVFMMIFYVEKAVRKGEISEEQINDSVKRILRIKGIEFS